MSAGGETRGASAPAIELTGVSKRFRTPDGSIFTALADVDIRVERGQFCAVVGPSGCGKSTTLTLVSGLERPSEGTVAVHGRPVEGVDSDVGFVFQSDALLPWKSVLDNVAAGPTCRGAAKPDAHDRAREWLRRVGLSQFADHRPHQLSGGMRKRVALARDRDGARRAAPVDGRGRPAA
jgi:NitT/TauT family transport system ATP-binding protein